jgi:hypothetical protein
LVAGTTAMPAFVIVITTADAIASDFGVGSSAGAGVGAMEVVRALVVAKSGGI